MKHLTIILAILMVAAPTIAAVSTMHNANQITIAWDPVEDAAAYRVYTKPVAGGDPVLAGEVESLQYTLVFTDDAAEIVGVQAVRTKQIDGVEQPVESVSAISWSDVPDACQGGNTFGVYYLRPPEAVAGIRPQ